MKRKKISLLPAAAAFAVLTALAVWLAISAGNMRSAADKQELEAVKNSVENAVTLCYAIEGAYPENLDRLTSGYGVVYDSSRFIVHYEYFAGNVRPSVIVAERNGS